MNSICSRNKKEVISSLTSESSEQVTESGTVSFEETFSRKVFIGGIPQGVSEDVIHARFRQFGSLIVDWPHKSVKRSKFPPNGYGFLIFKDEKSVHTLINACIHHEDGNLYMTIFACATEVKLVQVRPWRLTDSDFILDPSESLDLRKTVFVGGVPRPVKAVDLAVVFEQRYGPISYVGIDTDPVLKYPKGAARVTFSAQPSYILALMDHFLQLKHEKVDKVVEIKPYVLDDQWCDECQGTTASCFCSNVQCLQYYCKTCWILIHSQDGRDFHKPFVKERGGMNKENLEEKNSLV